jgi:hypothetical protein
MKSLFFTMYQAVICIAFLLIALGLLPPDLAHSTPPIHLGDCTSSFHFKSLEAREACAQSFLADPACIRMKGAPRKRMTECVEMTSKEATALCDAKSSPEETYACRMEHRGQNSSGSRQGNPEDEVTRQAKLKTSASKLCHWHLPNSVPFWYRGDYAHGMYECRCPKALILNASGTGCEAKR